MKQVINILLKKDKSIEKIREKYVPDYKKFKPHINLVYPFEINSQKKLYEHINKSIKEIKPFKLALKGLKKSSKEFYLYLLADEGNAEIIKLYGNLNSGLLKDFKNKSMPKYTPHLTIGVFKTKKEIDCAMKELKGNKIKYKIEIKSVQLVTLNKDNMICKIKNFVL